jgi:predicted amidohydrolase YtcJ
VRIFVAARILTMEPDCPEATAIAVDQDRILAVGDLEGVKSILGGRPFEVDLTLSDKVILPGLIEQHLHPILSALSLTAEVIANDDWDLPRGLCPGAATPEAYRQRLGEAVSGAEDEVLFSWGYHPYWHGDLDRALLDDLSPRRPVVVWHRSCHEFFLNSAALDHFGITEDMTQGHGLASRQADWGRGHFFEKGLDIILPKVMPRFASPQRMVAGLEQLKVYLRRSGVTALNEPGAQISANQLALYQSVLGAEDALFSTLLIVDGRSMFDRYGPEGAVANAERIIATAPTGKVRYLPGQIKFFADGAIVSQKMQMKDGYIDGHEGQWMTEPEDFRTSWNLFWKAGYQPHTHVNGDLGLDMVLDCLEASLAEQPRDDHRAVIVHFANSTETQVERIARSGAVVSANPYYVPAFADAYGDWGLGRERADAMTRLGSCVRAGVPVSLHSDMPIGPARPLFNAWAAVNRRTVSGRIAGPDQRLGVEEALRAVTIEAARSWRMEHEMGSLAPGKLANLTVLDQDPTAVDPEALKDVPIWGLMFEGRLEPSR